MSNRRVVVGVMGAGEGASAEAVALAEVLGECISARGWVLLTGGRPAGVMAAASRGAARVDGHLVVGVLPDEGKGDDRQSTAELDLALFTGMGKARNVINVLSADVVVISKIDLAEAVGFDRRAALAALAQVAPQAAVVEVSARSGAGIGRLRELCG